MKSESGFSLAMGSRPFKDFPLVVTGELHINTKGKERKIQIFGYLNIIILILKRDPVWIWVKHFKTSTARDEGQMKPISLQVTEKEESATYVGRIGKENVPITFESIFFILKTF